MENKGSGTTLLTLTFYQLMIWLPDGKICSAHKSCRMRKCTGLLKWGRRKVSWNCWVKYSWTHFHIQFLTLLLFSILPLLFIQSFVLLSSRHFSSSLSFDPPCECSRDLTFSHLLEEDLPGGSPVKACTDLYVLVKYITVWVSHDAVQGKAGGAV